MDAKLQIYRGDVGPDHVDFRKSTGSFLGSPEDEHSTVLEVRVTDEDLTELGLSQEQFLDACAEANKVLAFFASKQPAGLLTVTELLGLDGNGPIKLAIRAFDND
jgi:hypothetical protein